MNFNRLASLRGDGNHRVRAVFDKTLGDLYKSSFFKFCEMVGKISYGQPGDVLEKGKVETIQQK